MYSLNVLERLCTVESGLVKLQLDTCRRRQVAEEALQRARRVQQVRQALAATIARVDSKKRMVERRAMLVEAASSVAEAYALGGAEQSPAGVEAATLVAMRRRVRQARIIVEDLRAMLARERAVCAVSLQRVFPMEPDGAKWTICGEGLLAADAISTRVASEQTALALGLVASAVDAAAKYLNAPVRFPVVVRGPRSAVVNPMSQTLWPLFIGRAAADRGRLRTAQRMLSVDVAQLLARLGVDDVDGQTVVANLAQLLMAIESASFA
ncbi:hypothetical protein LPJ59_002632 [Coemansia sp. RSA 2399]|nr:hypothetical protein LPJ59_002632 [Coemansia sp. RSA 2399]KAJ1904787.1 hypothetical protein LPJ81_002292 [Coemansia sp. IMI 209127]